jgi:membrane protein required for colicin V production
MPVTLLDGIVLAVVIISAVLAMVRGFVREVLSVASWVAAAAAAYLLHKPLIPLVTPYINNKTAATVVAAAAIFFVALIIASYVTMKVSDFIIDSRIGFIDRSLGLVFGAARGLVIIAVAYKLFAGLVNPLPPFVQNARVQPILDGVGTRISQALPSDLEGVLVRKAREAAGNKDDGDEKAAAAEDGRGNSATERGAMDNLIRNTTGGAAAPAPAARPSTGNGATTNGNTRR